MSPSTFTASPLGCKLSQRPSSLQPSSFPRPLALLPAVDFSLSPDALLLINKAALTPPGMGTDVVWGEAYSVGRRPSCVSERWLLPGKESRPHILFCILHVWGPQFNSVQSLSHVQLFVTPWTAVRQAFLSITNSRSPPKSMSIDLVMPSNHLILCYSLLLLPSIFQGIRVFSNESALHIMWTKCWSFSFNISPSNEHPGLITFRVDWLDLLAVQGTLNRLPQHHSSKVTILQLSAFFTVQLSHPYMTTGKTITLTRWTFVGKVMSLLSNMLSRLVITFFARSKRLLISWLQSPSEVILEPKNGCLCSWWPWDLAWHFQRSCVVDWQQVYSQVIQLCADTHFLSDSFPL